MKTVIYTTENNLPNEIETIIQLFENGLDFLYIRKPNLDDFSLVDFVETIPEKYWQKCISNSLIITKEFNLGGYHFTKDIVEKNKIYNQKILTWLQSKNKISSVSAHNITEIKKYNSIFNHLIISPIFKSISKENHSFNWSFEDLKTTITNFKNNKTSTTFFAVGGINFDKIEQIKNNNFDGIGLLGAIWNNENAIDNFNAIKNAIN